MGSSSRSVVVMFITILLLNGYFSQETTKTVLADQDRHHPYPLRRGFKPPSPSANKAKGMEVPPNVPPS
ncbi:hypothetical protein IFM89_033563, partial [Coptis chinensis]